jgi:two-component system KDP operon response regulator KdpE
MLARIRVALRHAASASATATAATFELADLIVDFGARRVFVRGDEIHLTPIDYKRLTTLIRNAGKVLTHRQLLKDV